MPNQDPIKVYKSARQDMPWMVVYADPTKARIKGRTRRIVRWFKRQDEALAYRKKVLSQIMLGGIAGAQLELTIKADALAARKLLDGAGLAGTTLLELARAHVAAAPASLEARKPIGPYIEAFLDTKRLAENRAHHTQRSLGSRLRAWCDRADITCVADINREKLELARTREGVSAQTRKSDLNCISSFCIWLVDRQILPSNPLQGMRRPVVPRTVRHILSAEDATKLLQAAFQHHRSSLPALATLMLAGLRPSELKESRFSYQEPPAIRVEGGKMRGRANRLTPIRPELLRLLIGAGAPERVKPIHPSTLQSIQGHAGVKWWPDIGRHSVISYRAALEQDLKKIAFECGTSESVILRHYLRLTTIEQARAYWSASGVIDPSQLHPTLLPRARARIETLKRGVYGL